MELLGVSLWFGFGCCGLSFGGICWVLVGKWDNG